MINLKAIAHALRNTRGTYLRHVHSLACWYDPCFLVTFVLALQSLVKINAKLY
jgi:hypothetical protein